MKKRDFLRLADLNLAEHLALFSRARLLKKERAEGKTHATLAGKTIALVFEKPSTRTRLSFEAAAWQLGARAITLDAATSQMGRGEPIEDTARVTASYVDAIMLRTFADARLEAFARNARVPVINGLSDGGHPVQLLADLMTIEERLGAVQKKKVAWIGDGASNMARSWIEAAAIFELDLRIAAPVEFQPAERGTARVTTDPLEAVDGADVVTTDVWTSMGQEAESARRRAILGAYRVDDALLDRAASHAIVLHCLPAHRGEEITHEVLEGARSAVWSEAENRMHAQKALLEKLVVG